MMQYKIQIHCVEKRHSNNSEQYYIQYNYCTLCLKNVSSLFVNSTDKSFK